MVMMNVKSLALPLLAAALLAPAAARAQERGTFVVMSGADSVMVERFTRTADSAFATADLKGRGHMVFTLHTGPAAAVSGADLRVWPEGTPESAPPARTGKVVFAGDSAITTLEGGDGNPQINTIYSARGALPLVNPSALMLEQILMRARALSPRDSVSVPVLVLGRTEVAPVRVRWVGADSAVIALGPVEIQARVDAAGHLLGASVPAQNLTIVRVAGGVALAPLGRRAKPEPSARG